MFYLVLRIHEVFQYHIRVYDKYKLILDALSEDGKSKKYFNKILNYEENNTEKNITSEELKNVLSELFGPYISKNLQIFKVIFIFLVF